MSLLDEVRESCRSVAEQAYWVDIDREAVVDYAASLPGDRLRLPEMDPAVHYLGHGEATVAYILTLDTVNFGSGYFPDIFGDRQSGYRTIAAALRDHFAACGPLAAGELRRLTESECAGILKLDLSLAAASELTVLYTKALNDLGTFLDQEFVSDFSLVVLKAEKSAERLVEILTGMAFFRDVATLGGVSVPFYKRAQLAAVDLSIALAGEGMGQFHDLERVTICADNLVPHVLRHDGVLRYREGLAARIDRGAPLPSGSQEEVEIRACSVHAGELIVAELQRRGEQVSALMLDNLLWHRGQEPLYRSRPRHRTRTVFY